MKRMTREDDNRSWIIYVVTVLIFYTSGVCFAIVYQEIEEFKTASGSDLMSSQIEIVFFTVAGIAHVPIGLWVYKNRKNDATLYLIAVTGSLVIVLLYIVHKTIANKRSTRRFWSIKYTQQNFTSIRYHCGELRALFNNYMEKEDTGISEMSQFHINFTAK
ncbi:MAG: hypothetical protein E6L03_05310 [Thaumarchaeota archaeon]|nr:MAG: hypothetical protein E6L03_05310 [Nitrososphaerota archaeon]